MQGGPRAGTQRDGGVAAVEERLALRRWDLRFADREVEASYRRWHLHQAVVYTQTGLVAALVSWALTVGVVFLWAPQWLGATLAWALVVAMPTQAVALYITLRPARLRWVVPSAMLANSAAGLTAVALCHGEFDRPEMATLGLFVALYFGFLIFRLRPSRAVLAAAPYLAANQALLIAGLLDGRTSFADFVLNTDAVAMSFMTAAFAGLLLERLSRRSFRQERIIEAQKAALAREHARAQALLENMLPAPIAARLKDAPAVIAERFDAVTVLFADLVDFTPLAARTAPERLVEILNDLFSQFDALAARHGVEKIKTIGDSYMAVSGVPAARADHALAAAALALDLRATLAAYSDRHGLGLRIRIGLATGPAIAGVIGTAKYAYDLWGDTVNLAARMESHGVPGEIQLDDATASLLGDGFRVEPRDTIEVKGKGPMRTYFLVDRAA